MTIGKSQQEIEEERKGGDGSARRSATERKRISESIATGPTGMRCARPTSTSDSLAKEFQEGPLKGASTAKSEVRCKSPLLRVATRFSNWIFRLRAVLWRMRRRRKRRMTTTAPWVAGIHRALRPLPMPHSLLALGSPRRRTSPMRTSTTAFASTRCFGDRPPCRPPRGMRVVGLVDFQQKDARMPAHKLFDLVPVAGKKDSEG